MYSPPNSSSTRRSIATRQRVSRACDRCNHLRVKCDGQRPCEHCLVYGLECKYERRQKKRGKGSLRINSGENSSTNPNEPMTPTTSANSPSSSPTAFHLSIPSAHLFCPEDKDGYHNEFVSVASSEQSSQHCTPEPPFSSLYKADPETTVYTNGRSRGSGGLQQQHKHCFEIPEPISYAPQLLNRTHPGPFDPAKCTTPTPPSNPVPMTPPEGYQILPYMPLCANCHCNPSVRLYPGSILWLPVAQSQLGDGSEYSGLTMCEGGTYCFPDQQKAMIRES